MTDLPAEIRVGGVGLSVADLDGAADFYDDLVGLDARSADDGRVVLGAGDEPLLELIAAPDSPERPPEAAGLYHVAYRVPDRAALADALGRLRDGWTLTGASDHLVSEALYFDDPEGNGVEVYRDRPRAEWTPTADGGVEIDTLPLDLADLAAEARGAGGDGSVPPGTDVGHVHLEVPDLGAAEAFYADALGMDVQFRTRGALFVAAGGYHHHVGLNVWNRRSEPAAGRGLEWFELRLPGADPVEAAADRLEAAGHGVERTGDGVTVEDPAGVELRLAVEG